MNTFNIKEEIAKLVEFIETASDQELDAAIHPVMFNKGYEARAQGFNQSEINKRGIPKQNLQSWADGWIAKDYQLWLDSKLDLIDWLEKNDRELK